MKDKKRRFILIDPSVKRPGGHHYEYAGRILDSARCQGYETLLLAHKNYEGSVNHTVRPTFSLTFWDNYAHYYGGGAKSLKSKFRVPLRKFTRRLEAIKLKITRKFIFSQLGLALVRARHLFLKDILLRPYLTDDASEVKSSRLILALARILVVTEPLQHRIRALIDKFGFVRLSRIFITVISGPLIALGFSIALVRAGRFDPAARFAREFLKAVKKIDNLEDTVIFIPNATAAEVYGLLFVKRASRPAIHAHWALLYRRAVFNGAPGSYKSQMEDARHYRVEFARLKAGAAGMDIKLYTDTDELSAQYNLFGLHHFSTLPVPVEIQDVKAAPKQGPLTIGYLGDARDEKGFELLPPMVEAFKPKLGGEPTVRFIFQSNYNVPEGEPGSRYARGLLSSHEPGFVELVDGPFDSVGYNALLKRMDVVVIPYNAENYAARSSGILMEALSIGLPVVVPAKSWMAGLVEPMRRSHLISMFNGKEPVSQITTPFEKINNRILEIDARANHVFIRLRIDPGFSGYLDVKLSSVHEHDHTIETFQNSFKPINGEVIAVFSKSPSPKMWWKVEATASEARTRPFEVEMSLFDMEEKLPLSAGAVIYGDAAYFLTSVQELVDHYEHNKKAAEQLREDLRPLYDPAVLVKKLGEDAFGILAAPN